MTNVSGKVEFDPFVELRNMRAEIDSLHRAFLPPAWTAVTAAQMLNGWTIWSGVPPAPAYMIDALGFVHIRGIVMHPTTTVTASAAIFNMPPGLRPAATFRFVTLAGDPSQYGRGEVSAAGDVLWIAGVSTAGAWFSVDNIHYLAEN